MVREGTAISFWLKSNKDLEYVRHMAEYYHKSGIIRQPTPGRLMQYVLLREMTRFVQAEHETMMKYKDQILESAVKEKEKEQQPQKEVVANVR